MRGSPLLLLLAATQLASSTPRGKEELGYQMFEADGNFRQKQWLKRMTRSGTEEEADLEEDWKRLWLRRVARSHSGTFMSDSWLAAGAAPRTMSRSRSGFSVSGRVRILR